MKLINPGRPLPGNDINTPSMLKLRCLEVQLLEESWSTVTSLPRFQKLRVSAFITIFNFGMEQNGDKHPGEGFPPTAGRKLFLQCSKECFWIWRRWGTQRFSTALVPSGYVKIAMENDHRNSESSQQTWWFSIVISFERLPEGISINIINIPASIISLSSQ